MTLTIQISSATFGGLQAKSIATGKPVATLVEEAVEADLMLDKMTLKESLRPLQDEIAASGLIPEAASEFLTNELKSHRAERSAGANRP